MTTQTERAPDNKNPTDTTRVHHKEAAKFGLKAVFNLSLAATIGYGAYLIYQTGNSFTSGLMILFVLILLGYGLGALSDTRRHVRYARD